MRMTGLCTARDMADWLIKREGLLTRTWSYDYGVVWRGMERLARGADGEKYFRYIKDALDTFVDEAGGIRDYKFDDFNLDYICDGRQLLYLYKRTGEEKYRLAADTLREQLRRQPRTSDGGFWHKKCYPWQMWLDGLHMATPFLIEYALMTDDAGALDDAAKQLRLAYEHTLDEQTGLNRHAWDEKRAQPWADPKTGLAAHCWGRAVGWYMVALVDALDLLPRDHAAFNGLKDILVKLADRMLAARVDGVWMQVVDCPTRAGNYLESSGSCLMTCAMLKGARLGLLSHDVERAARESFVAINRHFVGRMNDRRAFLMKCCLCAGLGGNSARDGSYAYYLSEPIVSYDLKGTGAYIQCAAVYELT